MAPDDFYDTVLGETRHRLKIERSLFIGIAFGISSEAELFTRLAEIEKEQFDATHHCWAFRLRGQESTRARSSDAGEPTGTAGKPILSAMERASLVDTSVIVVRYFGGVKLGTGGLSRAYRECASETLDRARRERRYIYDSLLIDVPFDAMSLIYRMIAPPDVILASEEYGETNRFRLNVRRSRLSQIERELTEKRLSFRRL